MLDHFPPAWLLTWVSLMGLCVGSFLNVVIGRLPSEMSVVTPGSHCPKCKHELRWYENIPLLSYAFLKGRCSHCKVFISFRYPLIEALMMCLSAALWLRLGPTTTFLVWWPLSAALLTIAFLDVDHFWIPDIIVFPALFLVGGASLLPGGIGPLQALLGALPGFTLWLVAFLYGRLTGKEGMGFGDVKLLVLIGAALGPISGLHVLYASALQGIVIGSLVLATGGHQGAAEEDRVEFEDGWEPPAKAVPFGPFLVLAAFEVVLFTDFFHSLPVLLSTWIMEQLL